MTTDRELLELAAKAAGYEFSWNKPRGAKHGWARIRQGDHLVIWTPLSDGREALRIAVKLKLTIEIGDDVCVMSEDYDSRTGNYCAVESIGGYPLDAICRAIVRAAAAIGKAML